MKSVVVTQRFTSPQAMDIAGLSKLSADTLVLIVSVLGFLVRTYSTSGILSLLTWFSSDIWVCY